MAVFSTIGSILNTKSNNKAAAKAGEIATANTDKNNALADKWMGINQANLTPYMEAGTQPLNLMQGAMGFGDQDAYKSAFQNFVNNSDYGFQLSEGQNAVNSGYAGQGVLQSGADMRGLEDYRQNLRAGYRGEFNNMLANQQALGLSGASALAGVNQNYQNTVTGNNNLGAQGAANAALSKQNALANGLGNYGGVLQGLAQTAGKVTGGGF